MELNKIQSSGSWGKAADDLNQNFSKVNNAVEQVKNATTRNKGYFSSDTELKSAFPSANVGDIAYVGNVYPYQTWAWDGSAWKKKNDAGGEESVNLGDYYTKVETDEKLAETDEKLSELGANMMTEDLYIHDEIKPVKIIEGAIIGQSGSLVVQESYKGIFNVKVYVVSNVATLLINTAMSGSTMIYNISSTEDSITSVKTGPTVNSTDGTRRFFEPITNVENGNYLFVSTHNQLNTRVFNADHVNNSLALIRDAQDKSALVPDEILANYYINTAKDGNNYLVSASNAYDIKYYNVAGLDKVRIRGCVSNNTLAYAFCTNKNRSLYSLADYVLVKPITQGNTFINEEVSVPDNATSLFVTEFKTTIETHVNRHYPIEVYGDSKAKAINPLAHNTVFENYILDTSSPVKLMPNKANYRVLLYNVSQYDRILINGYGNGNVTHYMFTEDASLNNVVQIGKQSISNNGTLAFDETVTIPARAKYIWITQNVGYTNPLTVCKVSSTTAEKMLSRIVNNERKYLSGADIVLCPVYGQSLAIGGDASPVATNYGNLRHREYVYGSENYTTESEGAETSKWGLMESYLDSFVSDEGYSLNQLYSKVMSFATGTGSTSITGLVKGTSNYTTLMNKIKAASDWAKTLGKTLIVPAFCWVQGEQDRQAASIDYKSLLEQLRIDIEADVKAITGQLNSVQCIVYQTNQIALNMGNEFDTNSFNDTSKTRMIPAQAQYELIRDNDYFHASTPIYPMEFVVSPNGQMIHITAKSQKLLGYYEGITLGKLRNSSYGKNKGLIITSLSVIDDTHVRVNLNVPCPPLVVDTDLVKEIDYMGFSVITPGNANIIKGVKIVNNSVWGSYIVVETTANCRGSKLRYAVNGEHTYSGWERGPRGNLRDSQGVYRKAIIAGIDVPLHNWCYACELLIE